MKQTDIELAIGACIAAVGAFLTLHVGWLSADPILQQTYDGFGLIILCCGVVLQGVAAWNSLVAERRALYRPLFRLGSVSVASEADYVKVRAG